MSLTFSYAKNNQLTVQYNNTFLHSSYNPTKEAERFISSVNITFCPKFILITEPGIGYVLPLLKKKFPNSKLIVIRYTSGFEKYNNYVDFTFNFFDKSLNFENEFNTKIGEENIINTFILQWPPSSIIFETLEKEFLISFKKIFNNAKTLLITREYYEKKWLLNTINNIIYTKNKLILNRKINLPVIILSSGPSLKDNLRLIKDNQNKFFIICLSSAIRLCIDNNIYPNLLFSTDGGYWAGEHLKILNRKNFASIPMATPLESYIPKNLLLKYKFLMLDYGDGLSHEIINYNSLNLTKAERNGTVAGTALQFALQNSIGDIYICGFDMSNQKGFQHTQINEIEINNSLIDNKLNNNEKRSVFGEYTTGVLPIYEKWFQNLNLFNRNVFRIINQNYKKNNLGQIIDISTTDFLCKIANYKDSNNTNYYNNINNNVNKTKLLNYLQCNINSPKWLEFLFPLSNSTLMRNKNNSDILERIKKEKSILLKKIGNILDE